MRKFIINLLGGITNEDAIALVEEVVVNINSAPKPFIMNEFVGFNELNAKYKNKIDG